MSKFAAILVLILGIGMLFGGTVGAVFTYNEATSHVVTVHEDGPFFGGRTLNGPFDMWSQSNAIEGHTLSYTDGKYFAEMDRDDPTRDLWVTATTLRTALGLGTLAYGVSALAFANGLALAAIGGSRLRRGSSLRQF